MDSFLNFIKDFAFICFVLLQAYVIISFISQELSILAVLFKEQ